MVPWLFRSPVKFKTGVVLTSMIWVWPLARESPEVVERRVSVLNRQRSSSDHSRSAPGVRGVWRRRRVRWAERARVLSQDSRLLTDMAKFLDTKTIFSR